MKDIFKTGRFLKSDLNKKKDMKKIFSKLFIYFSDIFH